jgi:hypothetical protein
MALGLVIGTTLSKKNRWNKTSLGLFCVIGIYIITKELFFK